jgi:hypothetical protein
MRGQTMGLLFHRVLVVVDIINAAKIPKGSVTVHRDSNSILHADLYWTPLLGLRRRALFENDRDLAFLEARAKCESKYG